MWVIIAGFAGFLVGVVLTSIFAASKQEIGPDLPDDVWRD